MKPRDLVFLALVALVGGGLYFLSTRARKPTPMPVTDVHKNAVSRQQCLHCHQSQTMADLEKARKHPIKWRDERVSCTQCHKLAALPNQASRNHSTNAPFAVSMTSPMTSSAISPGRTTQ
jgi:hypothetical protein